MTWLEKYKENFTEKQLRYLGYEEKIEIIQDKINFPNENKEKKEINNNQKFEIMDIKNLSLEQRQAFLLSDEFFELVFNKFLNKIGKGQFEIPQKYLKMADVKLIVELRKDFIKIAKENDFTITSLLNYIFGEFIEKYEHY